MFTLVCPKLIGASCALLLTFTFALDCAKEKDSAIKANNRVKILFISFVFIINNLNVFFKDSSPREKGEAKDTNFLSIYCCN